MISAPSLPSQDRDAAIAPLLRGASAAHMSSVDAATEERLMSISAPIDITLKPSEVVVPPESAAFASLPRHSQSSVERETAVSQSTHLAEIVSELQPTSTTLAPHLDYPLRGNLKARAERSLPPSDRSASRQTDSQGCGSTKHAHVDIPEVGPADCAFWEGNASEDSLSEAVIKNGYADKAQLLNEGNSARQTLWPHLRGKAGLHSLSTFLGLTLQQRLDSGLVPVGSSFKPPPRVTLTDSKREAWLKELADDSVSLRKLSKTIPHGIRGKALLEQCLAKQVPPNRAIWLAKCIGANELRAFRRKGVNASLAAANESKWVKEWTALVEDFLDQSLTMAGGKASRSVVEYVLRLALDFFAQNLLHRRHFLFWLCHQLTTCHLAKAPAYVLLADVLLGNFYESHCTLQRLAQACACRLGKIVSPVDADIVKPLLARLENILSKICLTRPKAVTFAQDINDCSIGLKRLEASSTGVLKETISQILNTCRETLVSQKSSALQASDPELRLAELLDSFTPMTDLAYISDQCLAIQPHRLNLVKTLITWATTRRRHGKYRTYLVATVLRRLRRSGVDTDELISSALDTLRNAPGLAGKSLGRLLFDLLMSNDFDAPRYFRWLLATGLANESSPENLHFALYPVLDIPSDNLAPQAATLRRMILREVGLPGDIDDENSTLPLRAMIRFHLLPYESISGEQGKALHHESSSNARPRLSCSPSLGQWILEAIRDRSGADPDELELRANDITFIRGVFTEIGDFRILGLLLKRVLNYCGPSALMHVADTISKHFWELATTGSVLSLTKGVLNRYRLIRARGVVSRDLVLAIMPIARRIDSSELISFLERELDASQLNLGIAAYTPASDSLLDNTSASGYTAEEEIERILASGTTMDEQTLRRVFDLIMARNANSFRDLQPDLALSNAQLLSRLRHYDHRAFDLCIKDWIVSTMRSPHADQTLNIMIPLLVGSDCLSIPFVVECAAALCNEGHVAGDSTCAVTAARCLEAILQQRFRKVEQYSRVYYRYHTSLISAYYDCPVVFIDLLQHRERCGASGVPNIMPEPATAEIHTFARILSSALQSDSKLPNDGRWILESQTKNPFAKRLIIATLDPDGGFKFDAANPAEQLKAIVMLADPFSYKIFEYAMQDDTFAEAIDLEALQSVLLASAPHEPIAIDGVWQRLLKCLGSESLCLIRHRMEQEILGDIDFLIHGRTRAPPDVTHGISAKISIVTCLRWTIPDKGPSDIAATIVKDMQIIHDEMDRLSSMQASDSHETEMLEYCMKVLIHLSFVHEVAFKPFAPSDMNGSTYLTVLGLLLSVQGDYLSADIRSRLYTAIAHFLTLFPPTEEGMSQVIQDLGWRLQQPEMEFLFGHCKPIDAWLHLTGHPPSSSKQTHTLENQAMLSGSQSILSSEYFPIRRWELISDADPNSEGNDTALSLRLFGAKKTDRIRV